MPMKKCKPEWRVTRSPLLHPTPKQMDEYKLLAKFREEGANQVCFNSFSKNFALIFYFDDKLQFFELSRNGSPSFFFAREMKFDPTCDFNIASTGGGKHSIPLVCNNLVTNLKCMKYSIKITG